MNQDKNKVLFVCTGNTCRSPMAEGLFHSLIKEQPSIHCIGSAGVAAYPGDRMSHDTSVILKAKGANPDDLSSFRSREVTAELLTEATHVFAMTLGHLEMLVSAFPDYAEKCHLVCDFVSFDGKVGVDVPDPIGQGPRAYQMVASVFEQALPCLVRFITEDSTAEDTEAIQ